MLKSRTVIVVGLLVLLGGFVLALAEVFRLRFAAGDIYPPYSSLRADPLGTRALYESLATVGDGLRVRRNFRGFGERAQLDRATLLVFGLEYWELTATSNEFRRIDQFVRDGGRLVISLFPRPERASAMDLLLAGQVTSRTNGAWSPPSRGIFDEVVRIDLGRQWGFTLGFHPTPRTNRKPEPVTVNRVGEDHGLPATVTWHSGIVLTNLAADWRVMYERDGDAVLAERAVGRGSVVLATDSYFASNEALRDDRQTALLTALLGPGRDLVFDETHLGVEQSSGLATLAREYGLGGVLLALLAVALLFVWKSACPFLPRRTGGGDVMVLGFDAFSGFRRLLRRAVPPGDIMSLAWTEWRKTLAPSAPAGRVAAAEALIAAEEARPSGKRNPVELYRALAEALRPADHRRPPGGPT